MSLDTIARVNPFEALGTKTEGVLSARDCMEQANLNWRVEMQPCYTQVNGQFVEVPQNQIPVRMDTGTPFQAVGNRYVPFQNVDCFNFLDSVIDDFGATYEGAGSFQNGALVYVMLKLPNTVVIGDDKILPYLIVVNSHNGQTSVKAFTTPIRIVCSNTLRLAMSNSESSFSFKHTAQAQGKIAQARESLKISYKYYDDFQKEVDMLLDTQATTDTLNKVLDFALPIPSEREDINHKVLNEGAITKVKLSRNKIVKLFENPDSSSVEKNAWGILNAINDWELWDSEIRGTNDRNERQAKSVVNGRLHPITDKAFSFMKKELVRA